MKALFGLGAIAIIVIVLFIALDPSYQRMREDQAFYQAQQQSLDLRQRELEFQERQQLSPVVMATDGSLRIIVVVAVLGVLVALADWYYNRRQPLVRPDARGLLPVSRHALERGELVDLLADAIRLYHQTQGLHAIHQPGQTPASLHYSPHLSYDYASASAPGQLTGAPEPPALPGPVDLLQVLDTFQPSAERILLGMGPGGAPVTVGVRSLCHVALCGATGGGKSNLLRLLLPQLQAIGARVVLADPHYAPIDAETGEDWRGIAARLHLAPAVKPAEIDDLLAWLLDELDRRLERRNQGEKPGAPVFLALDELPIIIKEVPDVSERLGRVLREGRKVHLLVVGAAQDFLTKTLGTSGAVRDCYRTAYYLGGDEVSARVLLDMQGRVDDGTLGAGVALVRSVATTPAQRVRVPLASNAAVARLLGDSWTDTGQCTGGTGPHAPMPDSPESSPDHPGRSSLKSAAERAKTRTPEEERIVTLFFSGKDVSEIVTELTGMKSSSGRPYQNKLREVQSIIRESLRSGVVQ
jgi:hypothetical protein